MVFTVGLTGGIGSGKSLVAQAFANLGAGIIDTDEIAHRLTAPGQPGLQQIISQFGADYLLPDGSLYRTKLRLRVFSDSSARTLLEKVLHPLIRQTVQAEMLLKSSTPYLILVVPLLLETGQYQNLINRVAVVDCPEEHQISRTMARSGLEREEVCAIMSTQLSRKQRLSQADDVIQNIDTPEAVNDRVIELDVLYRKMAETPQKY